MTSWSASALDYELCRYGGSRLLFRGPKTNLETQYLACLGGSETFGKFVITPFAETLGQGLGATSLNLGCHNAGIDAFLHDDTVLSLAARARVSVVQMFGACEASNQFYMVHPRRNDRFLQASPLMTRLFPEVDFSEFSFVHHLLRTLEASWPEQFQILRDDIQSTWCRKMERLLARLDRPCALLWVADHAPSEAVWSASRPSFVTRQMVEQIRPLAAHYVEVVVPEALKSLGIEGMRFLPHEHLAAKAMPGPETHRLIAQKLEPVVRKLWEMK